MCLALLMLTNKVKAQWGYLKKGTSYIQGNVADQGIFRNNRLLLFIENEKPVMYAPNQVEEYGLINGDVYVKRAVHDEQKTTDYFLLRLVNGERTLYELKEKKGSRFFLEQDTSLIEIKKKLSLKDQLRQLKPCSSNQQIAKWAHYGETSLKRTVLLSNKCYDGFIPQIENRSTGRI